MTDLSKFACDSCGACCSGMLIIEIDHLDVVREPKLLDHAKLLDGNGKITFDSDWEKQYGLSCSKPCGLLGSDNRCTIYSSRPNVCVGFEAGSARCQTTRRAKGLPYLADVDGRVPTDAEILDQEEKEFSL